jgi:uncharacterized protein (TIGR02246 family)
MMDPFREEALMSIEKNKEAVRRLAQKGWSEHDLTAFDDFFTHDAVWHGLPPEWGSGLEQIKNAARFWFEAIPDFTFEVEDLVAEGDRVAFRWTASGIQRGDVFGAPPTNKHVEFSGVAIKRFENGRCVDYREVWDRAGLMDQIRSADES